MLFNPETSPQSKFFLGSVEVTAQLLGVAVIAAPVRDVVDIEPAIEQFSRQSNGGVILPPQFVRRNSSEADHSADVGLPSCRRSTQTKNLGTLIFARDGGLIYYGASSIDQFRGAASYVDRILRGDKPGDLPVQFPTRFELVINLKTAKAIGLHLPESLLLRADEVIE